VEGRKDFIKETLNGKLGLRGEGRVGKGGRGPRKRLFNGRGGGVFQLKGQKNMEGGEHGRGAEEKN